MARYKYTVTLFDCIGNLGRETVENSAAKALTMAGEYIALAGREDVNSSILDEIRKKDTTAASWSWGSRFVIEIRKVATTRTVIVKPNYMTALGL